LRLAEETVVSVPVVDRAAQLAESNARFLAFLDRVYAEE